MLGTLSNIVSAQYDSFLANWVLVITWSNVQAVSLSPETNTFQAILLTNGAHSYVVFNYDPCGMNWDPAYLANPNVIQGFNPGRFEQKVYVDLPPGTSVFRPGSVVGNSGMMGRWVYQLDTLQDNFINPRLFCYNWYDQQRSNFFLDLYAASVANTCPCSLQSARRDRRWVPIPYVLPTQFSLGFDTICYVRRLQFPWLPGPQCCYNIPRCDFLRGVLSAGVASVMEPFQLSPLFFSNSRFNSWFDQGFLVRYYCCEQSSLCRLYRRWRPIQSCRRYRPPRWSWTFGDPHMRTLDGLEYTFNGLGEYTITLINDDSGQRQFELQGRTQRVLNSETQQLSEATFFTGFAAEYVGDARIEIKLNSDGTDLETKVNGASVTPTADGLLIGNFTVLREENPIKIIAVYQADIQFSVGVSNSFADITTQLSEDYMNKTKGLLGVWDGDTSNDALRRDNTQQTATGTDGELSEQDFFQFGQTWAISESDSLFYYVSPGESFSNMNDPSFTPKFLDDLMSEADPAKLQAARDACGSNKVCLYDALATGSTDVGVASMQLSEQNSIDNMAATNFPPNVTLVETVEVVVGQPFTLQIEAVDPDGDDISYELLEVIPGGTVTSPGGQFTWTPADRSKVTLGFLVTDGKANATLEPIVKLCDCKNAGTCLYDEYVEGTNVITDGRFGVVLCNCTPGWSGDFCEMNYDACQDNPCFLGVACFDDDPPSLNFTCGSCPEGTEGDGKSCIDIDECVVYRDEPASNGGRGCDQNCVNTLHSFNCSCNSGYSLFVDGKRCIEINECDQQTDDCAVEATCNNTQGGYECSCNAGFSGDGTSCQDINECSGTNDCDSGADCSNTIGSYRCQCRQGYEGSGFTCTDVNECSRDTDECNIQAMCDNTQGSYTCTCNEGLSGDGRNCTNVNECEGSTPVCHVNATCTDIPGSFTCQCSAGFNGNGTDCQDIDECDLEIDNCLQNCRNTIGSYECVCHEAFTLRDGSCVATTNCSENSICVNGDCYVNGADIETCLCYRGYQNSSDPMVCEDINECNATESYCGPSSTCNNTAGGFECLCSAGFRQGNNQRDCLDIDECTLPVDDPLYPVCIPTANCYNDHGSYDCRCKSGYGGNGTHCQNVDECQNGHSCVADSTCLDNDGSYTCQCNTGFRGDGLVSCMNIDECLEDPDICHALATCSDTEGSYRCNCDSGYQGNGTYCEDDDECMANSHDCASGRADCVNNVGSHTCTCMNGYLSAPGMLPGRQCDDIDECALNLDSCDVLVSRCNNNEGSYVCDCLSGLVMLDQCIDINECHYPNTCGAMANSECVNLHRSYECQCRMGFYRQNSECLSGVSYNASAVFDIISGELVGGNGFNLVANYLTYRAELKDAIEAAFRSSVLSGYFGDVVISEISLLTDSMALLRLVINLNMSQPEQFIIDAFLSQLTGGSGGQLAPNHRLVSSTFIIGDPKCNSSPCTNSGTCADDNSVLPEGYTCTCLPGYSGHNCEIAPCDNNPCMNDGTCRVNSTTVTGYMCECALGYSGPQCQTIVPCELSNDCMNAATCVNEFVNARGYTCMCADGFMGENCENECSLTCMNGGTRDPATCLCVCSSPWTGDTCTECSLTCMNGAARDSDSCRCMCIPPWTGDTCTECSLTCMNGGTRDPATCLCVCSSPWTGDTCTECSLTCMNGAARDSDSCRCMCIPPWTGDTCTECSLTCMNGGTTDPATCQCVCSPPWTGDTCTECLITCGNGATRDPDSCQCMCSSSFTGDNCTECSLTCMNGAARDSDSCRCMCIPPWTGETCTECSLTCMNGGTRDPATCQCVCSPPWTGDTCTECLITCGNGATRDPDSCQCMCSSSFTGDNCTECPLTTASCMNGGTLDEEYCECVCPLTHSGDLCQDSNVCLTGDQCSDATTGRYCVPSNNAFTCQCRTYDAFFMEGAACENRRSFSLTVVITLLTETYRSVYINPWSSAFRAKAALYKRLVELRLRNDTATSDLISADCVSIQSGSVVATMVLLFPAAPPRTDVQRVLSENRPLTDVDVAITTDPPALRVNAVTDCPPDYCQNGAMCVKSGYYVSTFTYTCSCGTSFAGERCETVIPVPTEVPTATTTESPGGISTEVIVIIIVACVVLFLAVVVLLLCLCLLIRRRYIIASTRGWQKPDGPRINYGLSEYTDQSYYQDNGYDTSAMRDEEVRMDRLMNVMSRSPYLQQGLSSRHDFIRPYIVTGTEEFYQDNQHFDDPRDDDGMVGRVAYNPMIYH
ncbi:neurogenic locus notch homolog protein 1-like isoform X3 [Patiria miniata]|uniref:Uncharacterized protein n=1 Tax=Patiria miniata TaxID=46514 RepID=A0A913Z1S9_PATMI|nr:neurogenic locus notch homolog protein 1-like isoform X3 [Patiria miniata]